MLQRAGPLWCQQFFSHQKEGGQEEEGERKRSFGGSKLHKKKAIRGEKMGGGFVEVAKVR